MLLLRRSGPAQVHNGQAELVNAELLEFIEHMVEPAMQRGSSSSRCSSGAAVVEAAASKA